MSDNRNLIIAIALSMGVLLAWQYFIVEPRVAEEQARQEALQAQEGASESGNLPAVEGTGTPGLPGSGGITGEVDRATAVTSGPRVAIDTPKLGGSILLKGARFDDLLLRNYHETVDTSSDEIVLFSPLGTPGAYFAEQGWTAAGGAGIALPNKDTVWSLEEGSTLTPESPVTLVWKNGQGLTFRRTISVDENYLFTVTQSVANAGSQPVTLYPYGLVRRYGLPETSGYYILHEGMIGVFGQDGLSEVDYDDLIEDGDVSQEAKAGGWLGITDKYWAAVLVPPQDAAFKGRFSENKTGGSETFQADYLLDGVTIPAGGSSSVSSQIFAGAKVVSIVDAYDAAGVFKLDLLIDWGWFYFLTKPLFIGLDFFAGLTGNFGIAILIITVLVKLVFFPLANRSYEAMSKMKKLQPEMENLREKYKDDKMKQQQELMELYKKEKVNPLAGCLPILIQIPVFFSLYKVLFVTIEMRHAPFFGWIQDLSAPDPTTIFNLFGLIPWTPPSFLMLGVWPILMGFTMFVQMKMNPAPADPMQQKIFAWMPLIFTFVLAGFPAGLVIYWAWNNFLSVVQQGVIMRRNGVKIELFNNLGLEKLLGKKEADDQTKS